MDWSILRIQEGSANHADPQSNTINEEIHEGAQIEKGRKFRNMEMITLEAEFKIKGGTVQIWRYGVNYYGIHFVNDNDTVRGSFIEIVGTLIKLMWV